MSKQQSFAFSKWQNKLMKSGQNQLHWYTLEGLDLLERIWLEAAESYS